MHKLWIMQCSDLYKLEFALTLHAGACLAPQIMRLSKSYRRISLLLLGLRAACREAAMEEFVDLFLRPVWFILTQPVDLLLRPVWFILKWTFLLPFYAVRGMVRFAILY